MTLSIGLNDNNDIFIGSDGNLSMASGLDAVLQDCATATKAQLGEMIYAVNSGIPNFQVTWTGEPSIPQFETAIKNTLKSVSGVTGIASMVTQKIGNTLNYRVEITTIYGTGNFNGIL